jgi:pSer/pThr/pTyr-binding forkhead associated (FHA) protein
MAVTVLIREGGLSGELGLTLDAPRVVIGRGKGCDIQLPDASVSLRHASIRQQGGRNMVVDEGSTNGVVVRGGAGGKRSAAVRLPPQTPHTLSDGDLVRVGRVWLEVRFKAGVASTPAEVRAAGREVLRATLAAAGEPTTAELGGLGLVDPEREYVLGRAHDTDLVLTEEGASRRHAAIARQGEGWQLRDLGSKSGTQLDGQAVGDKGMKLADGAVVKIGATELTFRDPLEKALDEARGAADVKMKPEELAAPPPGMEEAALIEAPGNPVAAEPPADEDLDDDEESAPRGALVRLGEEPPPGGYAAVDAFVILIALGLMGLSALGLAYVLG